MASFAPSLDRPTAGPHQEVATVVLGRRYDSALRENLRATVS
ncbi:MULTISPECIES: hypothetical protein [Kineosporia]|nr:MULTISPECIES: hypothetical protein [Kineosporia]